MELLKKRLYISFIFLMAIILIFTMCSCSDNSNAILPDGNEITDISGNTDAETDTDDGNEPDTDDDAETDTGADTDIKEDVETPSSFTAYSKTLASGVIFNYFLYSPENAKENMPFIVYLHGGSGKPTTAEGDLNLLIADDGLPKFVKDKQLTPDCYIVFPQLPCGKKGWSDVKVDLRSFILSLSTDLNCDNNKISITGHSMGGKGTWDIVLAYPTLFYKVAPLSGNVVLNDTNLNKLKNANIWTIVGTEDTIVDPQTSIDFINALAETNKNAKITIIEGYGHFDVPNAYLNTEVLNWLINSNC